MVLALLALIPFMVALRAAPVAQASPTQYSVMMDDNLLLYSSNAIRLKTLEDMKSLGVQAVRATLLWSAVASRTKNPATHHRFNPANPGDYPRGAWANYDQLVEDAATVDMTVYFDVTGPGPSWAMGKTSDPTEKPSFMPNVSQFAKFVTAVGTRYSGTYHGIGRVTVWSIWNEPNQVGWLSPQGVYNSRLHAVLPYSPILYRKLWYAARRALDQTGHANDTVLAGETAPLGSPPQNGRTPMRPALFIQQFFCVNSHLQPYTGLQASVRGCSIFKREGPIEASGWAHHPYTKAEPPTWDKAPAGSIVIGNIAALPTLLNGIATNTGRVAMNLPVWITEMGYETKPPDRFRGVSLDDQAAYINETDYMAYKNPDVIAVTQFLYQDAGPDKAFKKGTRGYWSTYQSGLEFGPGNGVKPAGTPKPAYSAYRMPIWIAQAGTAADPQLELWTWVRFISLNVTSKDEVIFQFKPNGSSAWTTVTPIETPNIFGFVDVTVPEDAYAVPGTWRSIYGGPDGVAISRDAPYPG
jgi:hypothetical protein